MSYIQNLRKVVISATNNNAGDNIIVAGGTLGAGIGSIRVWKILLNSSAANTITPKSGSTTIAGQIVHTASFPTSNLQNDEQPVWEALPGQNLVVNFGTGNVTTGTLWYSLA